MNTRALWTLAGAAVIGLTGLVACESDQEQMERMERSGHQQGRPMRDATSPRIAVAPSTTSVLAGEVVTVTVHTENTLGRNAEVQWTSTGGDIRTEDSGRIARVYVPRPGIYTITATLMVDGREVDRDSVNINAKPLP